MVFYPQFQLQLYVLTGYFLVLHNRNVTNFQYIGPDYCPVCKLRGGCRALLLGQLLSQNLPYTRRVGYLYGTLPVRVYTYVLGYMCPYVYGNLVLKLSEPVLRPVIVITYYILFVLNH